MGKQREGFALVQLIRAGCASKGNVRKHVEACDNLEV